MASSVNIMLSFIWFLRQSLSQAGSPAILPADLLCCAYVSQVEMNTVTETVVLGAGDSVAFEAPNDNDLVTITMTYDWDSTFSDIYCPTCYRQIVFGVYDVDIIDTDCESFTRTTGSSRTLSINYVSDGTAKDLFLEETLQYNCDDAMNVVYNRANLPAGVAIFGSIKEAVTTTYPSNKPSEIPSLNPSAFPTRNPSSVPTKKPSSLPTNYPTQGPAASPTYQPTFAPSATPTVYFFIEIFSVIETSPSLNRDSTLSTTQETKHRSTQRNFYGSPLVKMLYLSSLGIVAVILIQCIVVCYCKLTKKGNAQVVDEKNLKQNVEEDAHKQTHVVKVSDDKREVAQVEDHETGVHSVDDIIFQKGKTIGDIELIEEAINEMTDEEDEQTKEEVMDCVAYDELMVKQEGDGACITTEFVIAADGKENIVKL